VTKEKEGVVAMRMTIVERVTTRSIQDENMTMISEIASRSKCWAGWLRFGVCRWG
jgi:hypothetical protein